MQRIKDFLNRHGTWVTISAAIVVLGAGIIIIDNPSQWWIALLGFGIIVAVLFVIANARVVLKLAASLITLLLMVGMAGTLGLYTTTVPILGVLWPVYHIALYVGLLALSYLLHSGVGRWLTLAFASLAQFFGTLILLVSNIAPTWALAGGAIIGSVAFMLLYLINPKTIASKRMPEPAFSEEFFKGIVKGAEKLGKNVRMLPAKGDLGAAVLVYDDKAYVLYPATLEQSFGVKGRKRKNLVYDGKSINPWLLQILHKHNNWRAKRSPRSTAIIDVQRKNGAENRIIGVSSPDTRKRILMGIVPGSAKAPHRENYGTEILRKVEKTLEEHTEPLTEKQKKAISSVGYAPEELTEFTTETPEEEV